MPEKIQRNTCRKRGQNVKNMKENTGKYERKWDNYELGKHKEKVWKIRQNARKKQKRGKTWRNRTYEGNKGERQKKRMKKIKSLNK